MFMSYYPSKDATLDELENDRNSGIDQIIELRKLAINSKAPDGTYWAGTYNSRILMQFDLTALSASRVSGEIPSTAKYYLKLWHANVTNLPVSYDIYAYPVSESWTNGDGNFHDKPERKEGVSWQYRNGIVTSVTWSNKLNNVDYSYQSNVGGGAWFTGSGNVASQSFSYSDPDIRMNVTDIVTNWLNGTHTNNGFIIKRTATDESGSGIFGSLKFFSRDTHTVYVPRLEVMWDDSVLTGTGSFTEITATQDYTVHLRNMKASYNENSKTRIRLRVRDKFPTRTYSTASNYLTEKRLPTSSYYSIVDYATGDTIVPFDTANTKVSCDTTGNYIDIRMNAFLPERYYELIFRVDRKGTTIVDYSDDSYLFKVKKGR